MIVLIGLPDASWQEPARFRARTKWPAEALRIIHPDAVSGPSDLPIEAVVGAVLDGTRPDLAEFYAEKGIPVEVVEGVPVEAPAEALVETAVPTDTSLDSPPDVPTEVQTTTEKPAKSRVGRGE